ncbi:MAG: helix-turn-helix domain-containing protein [Ardenticatenaceae bacterium]|nr:helix-turn-helix domain-containing protein [Ardenticatenaceae bacterium]MCB8990022.1 helix-turn-helix domain-containing protein [Ardenticatenaceae bacterium]
MNDELFDELLESVREGGAILRGEKEPSRTFTIEAPDVRQIREQYQLSQSEFAALLGISIKTLQNWEQGRRTPHGSARILLQVAAKHPEAVWDVVQPTLP